MWASFAGKGLMSRSRLRRWKYTWSRQFAVWSRKWRGEYCCDIVPSGLEGSDDPSRSWDTLERIRDCGAEAGSRIGFAHIRCFLLGTVYLTYVVRGLGCPLPEYTRLRREKL